MLPRIEPVSEALTTSCSPSRSAARAMINSAALPNDAFNRPPAPAPTWPARCSVALPMSPARGTIASAEDAKTRTGSAWSISSAMERGTKIRSRSSQEPSGRRIAPTLARPPHLSMTAVDETQALYYPFHLCHARTLQRLLERYRAVHFRDYMALRLTPLSGTTAYNDRMGAFFPELVESGRIVQGYSVGGPLDRETADAVDRDLADTIWRSLYHQAFATDRRF